MRSVDFVPRVKCVNNILFNNFYNTNKFTLKIQYVYGDTETHLEV